MTTPAPDWADLKANEVAYEILQMHDTDLMTSDRDVIADEIRKAHARGRNEGLEEAASKCFPFFSDPVKADLMDYTASMIRQLKSPTESGRGAE